jgi:hypothetical protein
MESPRQSATFIVRIARGATGELIGSVQRALTGERRPFHRAEAIGPLIAEMIATGWPEAGEPRSGKPPESPQQEVSP